MSRARWKLSIQVDEPFRSRVRKSWLRKAAMKALSAERVLAPAELSLVVTTDEVVGELNRTYRGVDRTTDVLAFPLDGSDFPPLPDGRRHLGEVIISCPQAARQAEEQGHQLREELSLLVIHGVLHLLGYKDEDPEEEPRMRAREAEILNLVLEER